MKKLYFLLSFIFFRVPAKILIEFSKFLSNVGYSIRALPKIFFEKKRYSLLCIDEFPGAKILYRKIGKIEEIVLPRVYGLSESGSISVMMRDEVLAEFQNVSVRKGSDFILSPKGLASNEKYFRKEYAFLKSSDTNLIEKCDDGVVLKTSSKTIVINSAFSMLGATVYHWGHFLGQYYHKLDYLKHLPQNEKIDVLINDDLDHHIRYLIYDEVKKYKNLNILNIGVDVEVICNKLYYCYLSSFIGDIGYTQSPFSIQISDGTVDYWSRKANSFTSSLTVAKYRKIYLDRSGLRGLINRAEVLNFFQERGFEVVRPESLDFAEKVKIFSEAICIAGPMSSGFSNIIFSSSGCKILVLTNSNRNLDAFISKFARLKKMQLMFLTGSDQDYSDANSSFTIALSDLMIISENDLI